jgi:hypothetical protein
MRRGLLSSTSPFAIGSAILAWDVAEALPETAERLRSGTNLATGWD